MARPRASSLGASLFLAAIPTISSTAPPSLPAPRIQAVAAWRGLRNVHRPVRRRGSRSAANTPPPPPADVLPQSTRRRCGPGRCCRGRAPARPYTFDNSPHRCRWGMVTVFRAPAGRLCRRKGAPRLLWNSPIPARLSPHNPTLISFGKSDNNLFWRDAATYLPTA